MSTIKTTMTLQDNMTPVFKSILRALDNTIKAMSTLEKTTKRAGFTKDFERAHKSVRQAQNALLQFRNGVRLAKNQSDGLANSLDKVSKNARSIKDSFSISNLAGGVYLLERAADALQSVTQAPDQAMSTKARIRLYNQSEFTNEQLYGQVYRTALNTRTGLAETGDLYTRLLTSGVFTGEDATIAALKTTETINKAMVASGATGEEGRRALLQLSQALASGQLQGDELRSIREQVPFLAATLAEGLAKVDPATFADATIGDLKELGAQGKITSDLIIQAFNEMDDKITDQFNQMPKTFDQAFTNIKSTMSYFLYLLSMGDNALGKIRESVWEFTDALSSPEGLAVLEDIGTYLNFMVSLFDMLLDAGVGALSWLYNNTNLLQSAVVALTIITATYGAVSVASWVAANAPMLLTIGIITLIISLLLNTGMTVSEVSATIIASVASVGAFVGSIIAFVWNLIVGLIALLMDLGYVVEVGLVGAWTVFEGVFGGVVAFVLKGIGDISLAVGNLISLVSSDMGAGFIDFGNNMVDKASELTADIAAQDQRFQDLLEKGSGSKEFKEKYGIAPEDIPNSADAYTNTYNTVKGFFDDAAFKWDTSTDTLKNYLKGFDMSNVEVAGGDLDSVGKIKESVSIKDEDIKLLRDISAQQILLNMNQTVPQVHATFGDIRETADVNEIMEALADMIEEAADTSLE